MRKAVDMGQIHQSTRTDQPLHLFYRVGLISLGLEGLALATSSRGAAVPISLFLGSVLIISAFLGLPAAVISYTRARQGVRPQNEAFFSVAGPLCLCLVTAWLAYSNATGARYLSAFVTLRWTDIARPAIFGAVALLNLAVFVANAVVLLRRRV
ncbi:MAG TPA: hypothetical protein VJK02_24355 [Anaerolineales bacterium]|nr:hypothetical protein [Anaerolineales bacterium]